MGEPSPDRGADPPVTLTRARLPGAGTLVDVHLADGLIGAVTPPGAIPARGEIVDCDGRFVIPGLWDAHTHMAQWALARRRVDVSGTASPAELAAVVAAVVPARRAAGDDLIVGYGYRDALWADRPSAAVLDAVTGDLAAVMINGDLHSGWLNSAALTRFGAAGRSDPVLREAEFFPVIAAISLAPQDILDRWVGEAVRAAASRGVVGVVDFEMGDSVLDWTRRIRAGIDGLRVVCSVWPQALTAAIQRGLPTGSTVPGTQGLAVVGPLKVISDGSLNTRTAYCDDPYPGGGSDRHGVLTVPYPELTRLMRRAWEAGISSAVHAIGDRAVRLAVDAFADVGCAGSVEHAQLLDSADAVRMAASGLVASVQPEHAMDDRDIADTLWAGRTGRTFAFRTLLDAGVTLALGSDAPVAPLDPWIAISAAVGRSRDGRAPWHPEQAIGVGPALVASTRGRGTIAAGSPADLVAVEQDPFECRPDELRTMAVFATMLAGRFTYRAA